LPLSLNFQLEVHEMDLRSYGEERPKNQSIICFKESVPRRQCLITVATSSDFGGLSYQLAQSIIHKRAFVKLLLFELLQKRINARRHRHYFSMEEKVRDRLVRLSLQSFSASSENSSAPSIRRRTRQRRPENSSVSSDLITVEFKINLGTLRFGIEGERERFDRVVFNFPHAGFHGKESGSYLICTFRFHVSTELHTDNMKWKQVKGGESKREQFVECTNRVCRVSSEIHIGELGRLSPRERTRFPYRYTKESPERHRLRFVKTLQFKLIKNHPQKVFMEFYKVKGRKMLIRNRYSQPSTQRIVLKIDMSENEKAIKKAMKLASGASGVRSVGIQGQNDQLVVVGAGIDTAELTRLLRKKVCPTTSIVTVQAAPPPRPQQQQQQPQFHLMEHHNEMAPARRCICEIPNSGFCGFCRLPPYQMVALPYPAPVVYREESDGCRIM
ncbi:hypothetical protein HID58_091268, partial [Brassica napus]